MARDIPEGPPHAGEAPDRAAAPVGDASPGLLRQKITVPEPVAGCFHRGELAAACLPTNRRLTLLCAPAGFGKTTLLAECCRTLVRQGVVTAWLSVDERDEPDVLDAYLAFAFACAGVDIGSAPDASDARPGAVAPRAVRLMQSLEAQAGPVVLALDEVERIPGPGSVDIVNLLLERGPRNLHLVIACREMPVGLQVAAPVFAGEAATLTADELRFSRPEIASTFGKGLTRREVAALAADSAGWPIALSICARRWPGPRPGSNVVGDLVANWVESRMWRGLSEEVRELVLDVGLFEWMDAELLDEVLEGPDLWTRLDALPALAGLLEPVQGREVETMRLHPLLQHYCARRRRRATPERFQMILLRIATVLATRGSVVSAMRYAADAQDPSLVGAILLEAGGVRLALRDGVARLQAADRFLTPAILEQYPRLALVRCFVLVTRGRLAEARRVYGNAARRMREPVGRGDRDLDLEHAQLLGLSALYGCTLVGSQQAVAAVERIAILVEQPGLDPVVQGSFEVGLCIAHGVKGQFEAALEHAGRARAALGDRSAYLRVHLDYQVGQAAMARGLVREASDCYGRGRRAAQSHVLQDAEASGLGDVLMRELELERNRLQSLRGPVRMPAVFHEHGTPLQVYAAASGTVVDLRLQHFGTDSALAAVGEMLEYTQGASLPAAIRYVSALRVSVLALAGHVGAAEQAWRLAALPAEAEACLDLRTLSWREMEAIASARLRLLHAREAFDEARGFASAVVALCRRRGLRRTWMRCLGHSLAIEFARGDEAAATRHMVEFLRLFEETDYARPLVDNGRSCLALLQRTLEADARQPAARAAARTLLERLGEPRPRGAGTPELSARQMQVLERLEGRSDREIAAALGLSYAGVRYHVRKIFGHLDARNRQEAVDRARRRGLLPVA